MRDVNILFGVPSPRNNISRVLQEQEKIESFDIFKACYYREPAAYAKIRKFFLVNPEYTHLAIACDDIVVTEAHLQQLKLDLQQKEYDVLSGVMNVEEANLNVYAITPIDNVPHLNWTRRYYNWYDKIELSFEDDPIFPVGFSGFCLQIFSRKFIEGYEFISDARWNDNVAEDEGGSLDVVVANRCFENKIPIMVDKRCMLLHLRRAGTIQVGKMEPTVEFIRKRAS